MTAIPRVVLAGGSGFLGRILASHFQSAGWEVVVLSRRPGHGIHGVREVGWDGETAGDWTRELEGSAAVVNLAGRSVDCRYRASNRRRIMDSRVNSTRALGRAIQQCKCPPAVWLNSSTATIYKHSIGQPRGEAGEIGATPEAKDAFSIQVALEWERTLKEADVPGTRKVALRTAMVLSKSGSVFQVLRRLVRFGLGGKMGSGQQYVSWIHEADFCRAVDWIIAHPDLAGAINLAAPNPLPNQEVMRLFRRALEMPIGLPAPRWMLEVGAFFLRTETELILKSRRVVPGWLLSMGFDFQFSNLEEAIADLTSGAE